MFRQNPFRPLTRYMLNEKEKNYTHAHIHYLKRKTLKNYLRLTIFSLYQGSVAPCVTCISVLRLRATLTLILRVR